MATWMSSPTGQMAHFVTEDGEVACQCPLVTQRGWGMRDDLPRCRRCALVVGEEIQACDVVAATGATYRQIDYWCRRGYINADPRFKGATSGTPRSWPAEELRVAREMARLVGVGLMPEAAHRAARNGGELAPGVRVVIDERADTRAAA